MNAMSHEAGGSMDAETQDLALQVSATMSSD
jgi:hypothetical protein